MVKTFRFHTLNGSLHIQTQLDGTFVRHSDYAKLEAQLAEALKALETALISADPYRHIRAALRVLEGGEADG